MFLSFLPILLWVYVFVSFAKNIPKPNLLGHSDDPHDELISILALSRHGVRQLNPGHNGTVSGVPYEWLTARELPKFDDFTKHDELTIHGAELIHLMGKYFQKYFKLMLKSHKPPCSEMSSILSYFADPTAARTQQTAEAFMSGFLEECPPDSRPKLNEGLNNYEVSQMLRDFTTAEQIAAGCNLGTVKQAMGLIGNSTENLFHILANDVDQLEKVLGCCAPEACGDGWDSQKRCTLRDIPFKWNEKDGKIDAIIPFSGSLGIASFFAELFQMQYCNGMKAAWGVKRKVLNRLFRLREMDNFIGINYWTAQNMGSELLFHIFQELELASEMFLSNHRYKKFQFFFTHHVNLQMIRQLLRLNWISTGWQMNSIEPGAMIVFELWKRGPLNNPTVRIFKVVATPEQQHFAEVLTDPKNPPAVDPISIPACFDSGDAEWCPLSRLKEIVLDNIRLECVGVYRSAPNINANLLHSDSYVQAELDNAPSTLHIHIFWASILGLMLWTFYFNDDSTHNYQPIDHTL